MQTSKPRTSLTLDPDQVDRILLNLDPASAAIFA